MSPALLPVGFLFLAPINNRKRADHNEIVAAEDWQTYRTGIHPRTMAWTPQTSSTSSRRLTCERPLT